MGWMSGGGDKEELCSLLLGVSVDSSRARFLPLKMFQLVKAPEYIPFPSIAHLASLPMAIFVEIYVQVFLTSSAEYFPMFSTKPGGLSGWMAASLNG